jgi:hypothetical protein
MVNVKAEKRDRPRSAALTRLLAAHRLVIRINQDVGCRNNYVRSCISWRLAANQCRRVSLASGLASECIEDSNPVDFPPYLEILRKKLQGTVLPDPPRVARQPTVLCHPAPPLCFST